MNNGKTGLILGKIAPFHKGHNYLIDTALELVDNLFFIVYDCPDRIHISTDVRADWIRKQYPQINVLEGWDAPNEHNDSDKNVQRKQEIFISKILKGQEITHFISSENYGKHISKHLNAENVIIDLNRKHVPISSTMIRDNLYNLRDMIPEIVYRDLITKVAIIGFGWKVTNFLINKFAKERKTIGVENSLEPKNEKEILELVNKKIKEFYQNGRIHNANKAAFFNNILIENYVLLEGTQRIYSSDLKKQAITQLHDFDIVFINYGDNELINNIESDFLNNHLISLLETSRTNFIKLEGSIEDKVSTVNKYLDLNLKSKKFL